MNFICNKLRNCAVFFLKEELIMLCLYAIITRLLYVLYMYYICDIYVVSQCNMYAKRVIAMCII